MGLKLSSVLTALLLVSFVVPAYAIENCADILHVGFSTQAAILIYGEEHNPGGPTIIVRSQKDYAFQFGAFTNNFFFISAVDQFGEGGVKEAYAGEMFYKQQGSTDFNTTYFQRSGALQPIYAPSNESLTVESIPDYHFSFRDFDAIVPVIKISYTKKLSFGVGASPGKSVIVLSKTIQPDVNEVKMGSVFLETGFGLLYVADGRITFVGACTPSCSDPDALDYYHNSTCVSTLSTATDFCSGASELVEYSCSAQDHVCAPSSFRCPYGCVDGKCVSGDKVSCSDSDGGVNILLAGRTAGNYANGSNFNERDVCLDYGRLNEFSCTPDKTLASQAIACPDGGACEDGACIPVKAAPTCVDTDGGRNYESSGTCSDSGGSYTDQCSNGNVVEYYCDAGYCKTTVTTCASCTGGYCPKSELVSPTNAALLIILIVVIAGLVYYGSKRKGSGSPSHSSHYSEEHDRKKHRGGL